MSFSDLIDAPPAPLQRAGSKGDLRKIGIHPNYWYPVAVAAEVKKGKAHGATFAGEPIVIVRTESGKIYALEDRCAHRQIPLRHGVVTGEQLKCTYHGWSYNHQGRCAVPYLPKGAALPKGVRAYPSREAYGLIFIFPGDAELAESVAFPDVPNVDSPTHKTLTFSRETKCHYSFMHENLLDMHHQFLHRRFMKGLKPTLIATRKGNGRVEVDYTFEAPEGESTVRRLMLGGKEKSADVLTIATAYPYQTLHLHRGGAAEPTLTMWAVYIPTDREQRHNHTYGFVTVAKPKFEPLNWVLWPFVRKFMEAIFAEDRFAVELEQAAHDAQGADWNQEILPFLFDLRDLLAESGVPMAAASA